MRARFELADVVSLFGAALLAGTRCTPLQLKVLGKISDCRTALLGGHEEVCDNCGTVRYSYNSCGDRHCPKCQSAKQAFWIDDLMQSTLLVKHYHIIFTVPHHLNAVCLHNQRMYYDILFAAVWNTLYSFGYTHYGSETGAVAVLHSWGQNLSLHPHIHCIVPAAGYALVVSGKKSVIPVNTFILCISLARPLKASSSKASNVPCKSKIRSASLTTGCRQHIKSHGWYIVNLRWQVLNM